MRRTIENEAPGRRYGRWTVLGYHGRAKCGAIVLDCKCDCGNSKIVRKSDLMYGISTSCGCYRREYTSRSFRKRNRKESAGHSQYVGYANKAKKKGIKFNLSEDEFLSVASGDCWYCGRKPEESTGSHFGKVSGTGYFSNGVDRVDNSLGYELGNVQPCCQMCNRSKNKFGYKEFVDMCVRIARIHGGV